MTTEILSFTVLIVGLLAVFFFDRYRLPLILALAAFLFTWAMAQGLEEEYHYLWHEVYSPLMLETLAIMAIAMAIVGTLNRGGGFFVWLRHYIATRAKTDRDQMNKTDDFTWRLSYGMDNMTVAVAMGILIKKFYGDARGQLDNLHIAAARVIAMANAGGAASPVGDITTILLWIAGFVSPLSLTMYALLPSLVYKRVIALWYSSRIIDNIPDEPVVHDVVKLTRGQRVMNIVGLAGFAFPVVYMWFGGLAVVGLMVSLALVLFVYVTYCRDVHTHNHLEEELDHLFAEVDIKAWIFIFAALMSVFSVQLLGGTDIITPPADISFIGAILVIVGMGLLSGVIENVALVLLLIVTMSGLMNSNPGTADLIAVCAGVGANWNLLGSVPGAILAGRIPGLTSWRYLKIAALPNLLAYLASVVTWLILVWIYTQLGWR